jgi:hypothetical protein
MRPVAIPGALQHSAYRPAAAPLQVRAAAPGQRAPSPRRAADRVPADDRVGRPSAGAEEIER